MAEEAPASSLPADLETKLQSVSAEEPDKFDLVKDLCTEELGQSHLFENVTGDKLEDLISQLVTLNSAYPGGLRGYIMKAKELLKSEWLRDARKAFWHTDFLVSNLLQFVNVDFFRFQGRSKSLGWMEA